MARHGDRNTRAHAGITTVEVNCMLRRSAAFALLVLPWDVGAQVGPHLMDVWAPQQPMPLSAAIAEIRKSPFHAASWLGGPIYRMELRSPLVPGSGSLRYQEAPRDTVVSTARVFVATSGLGLVGYLGGALIVLARSSDGYELLAASVPIVAVGAAAWGAGADPGRAAIGSILGGAIGIPIILAKPTNSPVIDVGLGILAHAAVTTLASKIHFRRRPRP